MLPNHPPPPPLLESLSAEDISFSFSRFATFEDAFTVVADAAANGSHAPIDEASPETLLEAIPAAIALEESSIRASPERFSSENVPSSLFSVQTFRAPAAFIFPWFIALLVPVTPAGFGAAEASAMNAINLPLSLFPRKSVGEKIEISSQVQNVCDVVMGHPAVIFVLFSTAILPLPIFLPFWSCLFVMLCN